MIECESDLIASVPFIDYLLSEEQREREQYDLSQRGGIWSEPIVPPIKAQIEREVGWILRRLEENRERYAEDIRIESDPDSLGFTDSDIDNDDVEPGTASGGIAAPHAQEIDKPT